MKYISNNLYLISLLLLLFLLTFSGAIVVLATPTLEVEDSIVLFEKLSLEAIETSYLQNGSYTDVLAGYSWSPLSSYSFAAKYIDGINSWYKYMVINNTYMYSKTMFSDVYDYIFVGSIYGVNHSSALIAKLDSAQGGIQCYNAFDSTRHSDSKLSALGYNYKLDMMVAVGAASFGEGSSIVQAYSPETYGLVIFFDKTDCRVISQYKGDESSWFMDVVGVNDPLSIIYGYTILAGYTMVNNTFVMPHIIFVDANLNVQASIVLDLNTTLAYATSVDFYNNSIVIGGTYKTFDRQFEGFIIKLDVNLYNITNDWTLRLTSYGNDSINDVYTGDDSLIAITGYANEYSSNSTLITGKLHTNGTINTLFTYGINNTRGNSVAIGPPYKLHVAGIVVSPYPNSLAQASSSILQNIAAPTIISTANTLIAMNNPIIRQVNLTMIDANPVIDYIVPPILGGLYIVIGEANQQNNNTETTTTTATTTLTTITSTGTVQTPTSTYTPANVTVIGPGPTPQFYCIDISTGTNSIGTADSPGTPEDPFNDYPDWIVLGNTVVQPRVTTFLSAWPMLTGSQARWISAHTNQYGQPLLRPFVPGVGYYRPPTTYRIDFSTQVPSTLNMTWTADNVGTLFIDGNQVQTSDFTQGLFNYSMNLLPGTHSIKVVVEDFNLYTGLYVSGTVCPINPEQTTISRPTTTITTTTTNTTIVNTTITTTATVTIPNEPCNCPNGNISSIPIIGGIVTIGLVASYLIIRKGK